MPTLQKRSEFSTGHSTLTYTSEQNAEFWRAAVYFKDTVLDFVLLMLGVIS